MPISVKAPYRGTETKWRAGLNCQSQCLSITPLENAKRRTRVQLGWKPNGSLPREAKGNRHFDAVFIRTINVERLEIELMHAALPSTYVGVNLRSDVNDVGAGDSRLARCQIDFACVSALRDECVAL